MFQIGTDACQQLLYRSYLIDVAVLMVWQEMMCSGIDLLTVLRLMCLVSLTQVSLPTTFHIQPGSSH